MTVALMLVCLLFPLPAFAVEVGSPAPAYVLKDTAGNRFSSSGYQGKIVLVSFWSPWCIPCRDELPALDRLYAAYRKDGFEVVAISVDPSEQAVSAFLRKRPVAFPVLLDDNKRVSDAFACSHLPTTIMLDRAGIVRKISKGYGKEMLSEYEQTIVEMIRQK